MSIIRTGLHGHSGPGVVGVTQMGTGALGGCLPWWDPNRIGLACVAAYRAINTVGTPWPCGPATYADSRVNQVNPGTNDLVEGNGAVPWAAATGWGFVTGAAQWLDTGLTPVNTQTWSAFVQFGNFIVVGNFDELFGSAAVGGPFFLIQPHNVLNGGVAYGNGGGLIFVAPPAANGNLAVVGAQGYRNGIPDGGGLPAGGPAFTSPIAIGALNRGGIILQFITADIHAVAIYDAGPAAVQGQALAIATAMGQL